MGIVTGEYEFLDRYPYGNDPIWPVTLEDLKLHIQLDHSAEDSLLEFGKGGWLAAATIEIERRGQISLVQQRWRVLLDYLPSDETIHLTRGPVTAITVVKYLDASGVEQTLAGSNYRPILKGKARGLYFAETTSGISLADGPGVVWVDYVAGFGISADSVPAPWRALVAGLANYYYERRGLVAGGGIDEAFERMLDRKIIAAGACRRYV
jgi:uncharacterized phiE125 gp8 family phage protein